MCGPMTFEQFTKRDDSGIPGYVNFFLHFANAPMSESYRREPHFQKFAAEKSDLAKKLQEGISARPKLWDRETLRPFEEEMYEAYLTMYKYESSPRKLLS